MWSPHHGYVIAILKDRKYFESLKDEFNKEFPRSPSMNIRAHKWDPGKMPLPNQKDMILSVSSENINSILETVESLTKHIPSDKFNFMVKPWKRESENIQVQFKPWISYQIKNSVKYILEAATRNGLYLGEYFSEGKANQVSIRFQENQRAKFLEDMQNLPLKLNNKIVSLKSLAKIKFNQEETNPIRIVDNRKTYDFLLWANSENQKTKTNYLEQLKNTITDLQLPGDINLTYPSPNEEMDKSIDSFKNSLFLSIGLVFLVIALMFNSFTIPLIVLATIPLAIIGVGTGLYLWKSTLSLNSMLGTILLCGLAVNNAIILLDFYIRQPYHLSVKKRISEAASLRLRPILMSTLTTLLGIFPVALGLGEGGEVLAPLGVSIFSGLIFSTALCLFFIPGIMVLLFEKHDRVLN